MPLKRYLPGKYLFQGSNKDTKTTILVDIGRKLNAQKTFRRRPGRLLNVLCTSNLRPVSSGI